MPAKSSSDLTRWKDIMTSIPLCSRSSRTARWHMRRVCAAATAVVLLPLAACNVSDLLDVNPDVNTVDATRNPPLLVETMRGATVDLNFAYDIWVMGAGMFGNEMNSVSFLRWEMANRIPSQTIGTSAGTGASSPNDRGVRANFPAWYAYLQQALASTSRTLTKMSAGGFTGQADPTTSPEFAKLNLYRGFEIIWLADVWCDFVLDGKAKVYTSKEGWTLAAEHFQKVLALPRAEAADRQAALAGLARVQRLLGNWTQAVQFAQQVDTSFQFQATYSTVLTANTNRVWFHLWSFGEHTVSARWRNLTLDGTTTPDPRVRLQPNPVSPLGTLDQLFAPFKVASGNSPLNITSGVEARFILAEAAIAANDLPQAVNILNAIRRTRGVTLAWQPATLDRSTVLNKLIDERGRTLLFEGVRVADLRFYKKTYGIDLWHTSIPQGSAVGTSTCHPLQQTEIDNIPEIGSYTFRGDTYVTGS